MSRDVLRKIACREEILGPGAKGYRSLGTNEFTNFDPFLLVDELMIDPDKGLPDHPHRGIQAITYILKGQCLNEDSNGYYGLLNPGDVQCLTVGKGVMHGVMPAGREQCHSIQLWLNLPRRYKMIDPKYQDIKSSNLPRISRDGIHLKVIAGKFNDYISPLKTVVPTLILDFQLEKGACFTQAIPNEWAAFILVLNGSGIFGKTKRVECGAHHLLLLSKGTSISFKNINNSMLHFVLFAGQQLNEPIFRHGPYVMNSQKEVNEAISDFEQGKNGFEKCFGWRSRAVKRIANKMK